MCLHKVNIAQVVNSNGVSSIFDFSKVGCYNFQEIDTGLPPRSAWNFLYDNIGSINQVEKSKFPAEQLCFGM